MTREAQLLQLKDDRPGRLDEPGLAELLDPVALEARLQEARARRSAALAKRAVGAEPAPPLPGPEPVAASGRPRLRGLGPGLLFALGLALGGAGAALLTQPDLRRSLALLIAPEIVAEIAPPAPAPVEPAPAPEVAPEPPAVAAETPAAPPPAPLPGRAGTVPPPEPAALAVAATAPSPPAAPTSAAPPAPALALPAVPAPAPPEVATEAPAAPAPAPLSAPAGHAPAPETPPFAVALALPSLPAAPEADGAPSVPAQTPPPAALPERVIVHFPASAEAEAQAARSALLDLGVPEVETVPVRFAIGASNLRYYHAGDRDGARRVAEAVAGSLAAGAPAIRDFTDYRPPPLAGRVEIWLAGAPRAAAPRASRPAPARADRPAAPPPMPADLPPADQAEAVARIIVERSLQRLLDEAPRR
jgi:hypothetical protein